MKNVKAMKISHVVNTVIIVGIFLLITLLKNGGALGNYQNGIIRLICINIILATSLNITVGCLGQINLGHAGFMSIGAYAAGIFMKSGILPGLPGYIASLFVGGIAAGIFGIVIGIPALRLKGDYLAIVTLAFGEIVKNLILFFDFTGGAQGLRGIPKFQNPAVMFVIMALSLAFMYALMTSRHGRAILAIREDEIASTASGVNLTYYKIFAFTISAAFAGVAGAMYGQNIGLLSADTFGFNYSINILVMVVLGGMGSFTGATLSAVVLTVLPEVLRSFSDYRMIIYSIILVLMMIFRPTGLLGRKEFQITKIIQRFISPEKAPKEGGAS